MSGFDSPTPSPSKSRRRLAAWLAFGAVGLATGAVWASGIVTSTSSSATPAEPPAFEKTGPNDDPSLLVTKATLVEDITFDWNGHWGSIAANTSVFKVDLTEFDAAKKYNVGILLDKDSPLEEWATLQLEFERVVAADGDCETAAATYNGGQSPKLLNSDEQDAGVYWNGLDGGAVYCFGVAKAEGDEIDGTFLRASVVPPSGDPTFIATVDRAS